MEGEGTRVTGTVVFLPDELMGERGTSSTNVLLIPGPMDQKKQSVVTEDLA